MTTELDLRRGGTLTVADAKRITSLEPVVREEYNQYIGQFAHENNIEDLRWLLRVTCRNTHISLIHDRLCRIALLEYKLCKGEVVDLVLIDSPAMSSAIRQLLKRYGSSARLKIYDCGRLKRFQVLTNLAQTIYACLNMWFWSKFVRRSPLPPETKLILLDLFLLKSDFDENGRVKDRYYPGLLDYLPRGIAERVFYLPTFFGLRLPWDWLNQFKNIYSSKNNVLVKEHWLLAVDYFWAIWKSLTLPNNIEHIPPWRGVNISSVVQEELLLDRGSFSLTQALLIFQSFERYKKGGIILEGVIDWFENQVGDRALHMGMKKYYPEVRVKGYMGFVGEGYYAGLSPVSYEYRAGTLPDELLMIGPAYIKAGNDTCAELVRTVAPALRFQDTIKFRQQSEVEKDSILLAMPMMLDEARRIIHLAIGTHLNKPYKWIIKMHPTTPQDQFLMLVPEANDARFEFSNQPLASLLQRSCLLVTSASSAALEAIVCGVSVAILGSRSGPTINPLEGIISMDYWSACYTSKDISDAVSRRFPEMQVDATHYLETVSKAGIERMMAW